MRSENRASEEPPVEGGQSIDEVAAEGNVDHLAADPAEAVGGEDALREVEALNERYLRLAAEYDNYRKRTERERIEVRDRAQAQLVGNLLDALDDLQRVGDYTPENTTIDALLEGVQLVETKLFKALQAAGLEAVEWEGEPFDPERHEALMVSPTEDPEEDETIGGVFQTGYTFRGMLLRPARVQVRKLDA